MGVNVVSQLGNKSVPTVTSQGACKSTEQGVSHTCFRGVGLKATILKRDFFHMIFVCL